MYDQIIHVYIVIVRLHAYRFTDRRNMLEFHLAILVQASNIYRCMCNIIVIILYIMTKHSKGGAWSLGMRLTSIQPFNYSLNTNKSDVGERLHKFTGIYGKTHDMYVLPQTEYFSLTKFIVYQKKCICTCTYIFAQYIRIKQSFTQWPISNGSTIWFLYTPQFSVILLLCCQCIIELLQLGLLDTFVKSSQESISS